MSRSADRSQERSPSTDFEHSAMVARTAYVIGLEAGFRGAPLEDQLREAGLAPRRVDAVDARSMSPEEAANHYDAGAARLLLRREMSTGEVGCALSHQMARVQALTDPSEGTWTLFFEDDARLTRYFRCLPSLLAVLPVGVPAVLVLWSQAAHSVAAGRSLQIRTDIQLAKAVVPPIGAVGYAMNQQAIRLAHERSRVRVSYVADWPPSWAYDTRFYLAYPWLAEPADVPSTLQLGRAGPEAGQEGLAHKLVRHVAAASGVTYLRHRDEYHSFRSYAWHELLRPATYAFAHHRGRRLTDEAGSPYVV